MLELDDILRGILRPRPRPYVATYIALRIDARQAGSGLMKRISNAVTSAAHPESPLADTWVSAALTYQGLKALGVPEEVVFLGNFAKVWRLAPKSWETSVEVIPRIGRSHWGVQMST